MIVTDWRSESFDAGKPVICVSGLMRSGTSMMMRILDFGGIDIVWDAERLENNKYGCFEIAGEGNMMLRDSDWIKQYRGKALKVLAYGAYLLPCFSYKMIFMWRSPTQIARSFYDMRAGYTYINEKQEVELLEEYQDSLKHFLAFRPDIDVMFADYDEVFVNTWRILEEIKAFLEVPFDMGKAIEAIDRSLYKVR